MKKRNAAKAPFVVRLASSRASPKRRKPAKTGKCAGVDLSGFIPNPARKVLGSRKGIAAQIAQARKLGYEFSGHDPRKLRKIGVPNSPKIALAIGKVVGIAYEALRDGEVAKYYHPFKKSAQPLFCVSPDGHQLLLIGGSYNFTDRGIEDA